MVKVWSSSDHAAGTVILGSPLGKAIWQPIKIKNTYIHWSRNSTSQSIAILIFGGSNECPWLFIVALFVITRDWKQSKCCTKKTSQINYISSIQRNDMKSSKIENFCMCWSGWISKAKCW